MIKREKMNKYILGGTLQIALCAVLLFTGCSGDKSPHTKIEPAHIEDIEGSTHKRLTLTEKAAQRLDIKTAPVLEEVIVGGDQQLRKVVPYSAILYDTQGKTFVYKNESPLVYERSEIFVDFIQGDQVVLLDGPSTGTMVVTVGAAELYGTEYEVGH